MGNHSRLVSIVEIPDDPYFQEDAYADAELLVISAQAHLVDVELRSQPQNIDDDQTGPMMHSIRGPVRLPRIELNEFDGTHKEWESFRDLFLSLVHNDPGLSDVKRLHYLKTSLRGDAASAIQGFEITAQNYQSAWAALLSRYDNHRLLVRNHIEALLDLKAMTAESAAESQRVLDDINRHRVPLKSLGREAKQWDDWFIALGSRAMDPATRLAWEGEVNVHNQKESDAHPTFQQLEQFLLRRSLTLKASGIDHTLHLSDARRPADRTTTRNVRSFVTTTEAKCPLCKGKHYLGRCDSFLKLDVSSRRGLVSKEALCLNCLRSQHRARDCTSLFTCRSCQGRHHTLIHEGPSRAEGRLEYGTKPKRARMTTVATTATRGDERAATIVVGDGGLRRERIRVLLDPCSEATLINTSVARRLGAHLKRVNVSIFGAVGQPMTSTQVRAYLYIYDVQQERRLPIEAYGLSRIGITTPACTIPTAALQHFAELELADSEFGTPGSVDAILGADVWSNIVLPSMIFRGGVVAQSTIFGWAITGTIKINRHN
ncbi:hypothetical protein TKK_0007923 [Trichogramma kaykai]